jgi:hypothetical protein
MAAWKFGRCSATAAASRPWRQAARPTAHREDLFTFPSLPGQGARNWRAEPAVRYGVLLRKVWAQTFLMLVWRACWRQGRCALDFLSQVLRGTPAVLAAPL